MVKNLPATQETWVWFLGWEDPWRRAWQPTPIFLLGESLWTEVLRGLSPWSCKESAMTEQLSTAQHLLRYLIKLTIEAVFSQCFFMWSCFFFFKHAIYYFFNLFSMPESALFFAIAQIFSSVTSLSPISLIHFSLQKNIVFYASIVSRS